MSIENRYTILDDTSQHAENIGLWNFFKWGLGLIQGFGGLSAWGWATVGLPYLMAYRSGTFLRDLAYTARLALEGVLPLLALVAGIVGLPLIIPLSAYLRRRKYRKEVEARDG